MSFDSALYSVVIDPAEYFLMSGSESGSIHEIKLYEQPKQLKPLTASASVIGKDSYTGHRYVYDSSTVVFPKSITGLCFGFIAEL